MLGFTELERELVKIRWEIGVKKGFQILPSY